MASYLYIKTAFSTDVVRLGPKNQQEIYRLAKELRDGGMNRAEFYINEKLIKFDTPPARLALPRPAPGEQDPPEKDVPAEQHLSSEQSSPTSDEDPSASSVLAHEDTEHANHSQEAPKDETRSKGQVDHSAHPSPSVPPMSHRTVQPPAQSQHLSSNGNPATNGHPVGHPLANHIHPTQGHQTQPNDYHQHPTTAYRAPPTGGHQIPMNSHQHPTAGYHAPPTNGHQANAYQHPAGNQDPSTSDHHVSNGHQPDGYRYQISGFQGPYQHYGYHHPPQQYGQPPVASYPNGQQPNGQHHPTPGYQPPPNAHQPPSGHQHLNGHNSPSGHESPNGHHFPNTHTFPNGQPPNEAPHSHTPHQRPFNTGDIIMLQQHEALLRSLQATAQHQEQITEVNSQFAAERLALFRLKRAQDAAELDNKTNQVHLRKMQLQVDQEEWSQAQQRAAANRPRGVDIFLESLANLVAVHTQAVIIPKVNK